MIRGNKSWQYMGKGGQCQHSGVRSFSLYSKNYFGKSYQPELFSVAFTIIHILEKITRKQTHIGNIYINRRNAFFYLSMVPIQWNKIETFNMLANEKT